MDRIGPSAKPFRMVSGLRSAATGNPNQCGHQCRIGLASSVGWRFPARRHCWETGREKRRFASSRPDKPFTVGLDPLPVFAMSKLSNRSSDTDSHGVIVPQAPPPVAESPRPEGFP